MHDVQVHILADMLRSAGAVTTVEPKHMFKDGKRVDLHIQGINLGVGYKTVAADVAIVSTQMGVTLASSDKPLVAARRAEAYKRAKYDAECKQIGVHFKPLVMENDGAMSEELFGLYTKACAKIPVDRFQGQTWASNNAKDYYLGWSSVALEYGVAENVVRAAARSRGANLADGDRYRGYGHFRRSRYIRT